MVTAMQAAYAARRKALELTYTGVATVTEHKKVKDEVSKLTSYTDVTVLEGQPCKLSFESTNIADQSESAASVGQSVKLFLAPEVEIKPGSKITVTQNKITTDYTHSSVPAVYEDHQEILLELFERWT